MRNLLALIGALVVGFGGLGWYLGWYKVQVGKAPDGNVRIETDVDLKKAGTDVQRGGQHVGELIGDLNKGGPEAKPAQPGPPGNTPGPVTPPQGGAQQPVGDGGWLFGLGQGK